MFKNHLIFVYVLHFINVKDFLLKFIHLLNILWIIKNDYVIYEEEENNIIIDENHLISDICFNFKTIDSRFK